MAEEAGKKADDSQNPDPKNDEGKGGDEGQKVDYAKLKAEREKRKELEERLAKIEADEAKKNEAKLLEEKKYQELLDAKSKELESAKGELESTRATVKRSRIENAIIAESAKIGAKDPLDVVKFVEIDKVELDDAGTPVGLDKLLEQVKKNKSYLFNESGKSTPNPRENGKPGNTNPAGSSSGNTPPAVTSNKSINSVIDSLGKARTLN